MNSRIYQAKKMSYKNILSGMARYNALRHGQLVRDMKNPKWLLKLGAAEKY